MLDARRQYNESGAQAAPLSDVIAAAKLLVGEDEEEVLDFCKIITEVEIQVLNELAEKRKRELEKLSKNKGKR